ncbi:MAG: hypothetical protein IJJ33_19645 [Victivallales bacterium]|nr:hypothetical protein [Victivallales bacterium]
MTCRNDFSCNAENPQLPPGFVVNVREDGTIVISHKIWKSLLLELLIAVGSTTGGYLLFSSAFQLAMLLFALAVLMLAGMWMNFQKLEYCISDGTFSYRRGPSGGIIAADDIATLDAVQLGDNADSFAVIAVDRDEKSHDLFRYLKEDEAKALLDWIVLQLGEEK